MSAPFVSVVIPVWHDVAGAAVAAASASGGEVEIIGAAAWEDADAVTACAKTSERMRWVFARRGRGNQMNVGAAAASGEWLLFLHADSVLPDGWLHEMRTASEKGYAAGCFRFGLDAPEWRSRLWEWLDALRVRYFDMPYGDQGLFVRRDLFEALGGYSDIPLMEDVEMVRRVRVRTRLYKAAPAVLTSARRWERDGWFRRSATNLTILSRYRLGTDVRRLTRAYMGTAEAVVGMMARAPSVPGKTRLGRSTEALRRALFLDTWDVIASGAWDAALVFMPSESADECAALVRPAGGNPLLVPQSGSDLGERMSAAVRQLFAAGYARVILIGSDLPSLPPSRLADADRALQRGADMVFGPAEDGGYYLVGLSRPTASIFTGIEWRGPDVLRQTLARAAAAGMRAEIIDPWYDIDSLSDLSRLLGDGSDGARRTKQVLEQGETSRPSSSIPSISIVIPCRNDAEALAATLDHLDRLERRDELETIVAACGDEQRTEDVAAGRATVIWPGGSTRAELLNAGAASARAPVLLFLHADSHLPLDAVERVQRVLDDPDVLSGAFEHCFTEEDWRLQLISRINRGRYRLTRNYYGDQAQFVRTATFRAAGGFRGLGLMEDLDLSQRLKRMGQTALVDAPVRTSGRRFLQRGPFRTLAYCGWLLTLRACGADLERHAERWRGPAHQPPGSSSG